MSEQQEQTVQIVINGELAQISLNDFIAAVDFTLRNHDQTLGNHETRITALENALQVNEQVTLLQQLEQRIQDLEDAQQQPPAP